MKKETLNKYIKGMSLYLSKNKSLTEISKELLMSRGKFTKWLKEQGVIIKDISKKYECNEEFFNEIDTEEKAYWLGFLYADGCVSENKKGETSKGFRLEVSLCKKDENHLKKLKHALNSSAKISQKRVKLNNKTFSSCRLFINSTKLCRDLIAKGCTSNKSLTLTFPSEDIVSKNLIRHFVRGYVDGDGSVMLNTKQDGGRLNIVGTKEFLNSLVEKLDWQKNKLQQKGNAYSIEYGGIIDARKKIHYLYNNSTIYLDRKYKKYLEIMNLPSKIEIS